MKFSYNPKGVCSMRMDFDVEDNKIVSLNVIGGCDGNLKGISKLVQGMNVDDVISKLEGTTCGRKKTSCPDQLATALKLYKEEASK